MGNELPTSKRRSKQGMPGDPCRGFWHILGICQREPELDASLESLVLTLGWVLSSLRSFSTVYPRCFIPKLKFIFSRN